MTEVAYTVEAMHHLDVLASRLQTALQDWACSLARRDNSDTVTLQHAVYLGRKLDKVMAELWLQEGPERQLPSHFRSDGARYRWLAERAPEILSAIAYRENAACQHPIQDCDACIDAAMTAESEARLAERRPGSEGR